MEIDYKLLGERIQEVRKTRNIKQYGLAESVGVTGPFMSQVESGKKQLSLESFIQIANPLAMKQSLETRSGLRVQ